MAGSLEVIGRWRVLLLAIAVLVIACGAADTTPPPAANPASADALLDLPALMKRAPLAFRREGDAWRSTLATHSADVNATGTLAVTTAKGSSLRLTTASFGRDGATALASPSIEPTDAGGIRIHRGSLRELVDNDDRGVEQSWALDAAPPGDGDLVVRVRAEGLRFETNTRGGLHFVSAAGERIRYGVATLVDARGVRTEVAGSYEDGHVVLRVPSAILEAAAYPAVLDPVIGPELALDTPVAGATGASELAPAIAIDGTTALVVWMATTDADYTIRAFAARVRTTDLALLDPVGIALTLPFYHDYNRAYRARVAAIPGSFLVAWDDAVELHARRVRTSDGQLLEAQPFLVSAPGLSPAVAANGTDFIVAYHNGSQLYGNVVGGANGVVGAAKLLANNVSSGPDVAFDGTNYLAAWLGYCGSPSVFRTCGTQIASATGQPLGAALILSDNGGAFAVASGGGNTLVATTYGSSTTAVRVRASDGVVLDAPAIAVTATAGTVQSAAYLGGNFLLTFVAVAKLGAIRVQGSTGAVLDASPVQLPSVSPESASVAFDGTNGIVVSTSGPSNNKDVYATRVRPSDAAALDVPGILVSRSYNEQRGLAAAFDGTSYFVVWEDTRNGGSAIYGARIRASDGQLLDPNGIAIVKGTTFLKDRPTAAAGGGFFLVAWRDADGTPDPNDGDYPTEDIKAARVKASDGTLVDTTPIAISQTPTHEDAPALTFDGLQFVVTWYADASSSAPVYATRIRPADGKVLDQPPIFFSGTGTVPAIASDGKGSLIVWVDYNSDDVFGARIDRSGAQLDSEPIHIGQYNGWQQSPKVASSGDGYVVIWEQYQYGATDQQSVQMNRVSSAGQLLDGSGKALAATPPALRRATTLAFSGDTYLAAWTDTRSGSPELYGAWLDPAGVPLNPGGVLFVPALDAAGLTSAGGPAGEVLLGYQHPVALPGNPVRGAVRRVKPGLLSGTPSTNPAECALRQVKDGVCCNSPCDGTCETCASGHCKPVTAGSDPDTCTGPQSCSSKGECKRAQARTCALDEECATGHCADGFCCNDACGGACDACNIVPGTCQPVPAGNTGTPSCSPYVCNGAAASCPVACRFDPDCERGYVCVSDGTCQPNTGGRCVDDHTLRTAVGATLSCAPYRCEGSACKPSVCSSIKDCADGFVCNDGACTEPGDAQAAAGCTLAPPSRAPDLGGAAALALALASLALRRRRAR